MIKRQMYGRVKPDLLRKRIPLADLVRAVHGIPWEFLPQELGFGSGMTCWRRLRDWLEAGCGSGCMSRCWPS
jgi:hypothetical protein